VIDFDEIKPKKRFNFKIIVVIIFSFLFVFYVFSLMFGEKSLSRMIDLEREYYILKKKVESLKKENALLQKRYFELKEIEGK
jgi:cell division protein FtsB